MEDLSVRQHELLAFVSAAFDQNGVIPSYREMGTALGISSTNAVSDHVKALIKKGYIERIGQPGRPRSLRLTRKATGSLNDDGVLGVPIIGRVAAGAPLLAVENYDGTLRVDASMLPAGGRTFALVVTGDSMIDDGIHHGDYLFVRQQNQARDGEIAVVRIEDEATVKRIYREGNRLRLQPSNADMDAFYADEQSGDVEVIGVAVGVFRQIR